MRCPDHDQPLTADRGGLFPCPRCGGAAIPSDVFATLAPSLGASLVVEADERAAVFRRLRGCPQCRATMVPHRFGPEGAWLELCRGCELLWAGAAERRLVENLGRQGLREAAFRSLDENERRELATSLAESAKPDQLPKLTARQHLLGFFGIPSLLEKEGTREPIATWFVIAVLVVVHVLGWLFPQALGSDALAYDSESPGLAGAFTSVLAHAGWLHLLGNVTFFAAFGDGLEQRLPRIGYLILFAVSGAFAAFCQGAFDGPVRVLGASGAIATVLGACVMLQPRARVLYSLWTPVGILPLRIPILLYGLFELGWQLLMNVSGGRQVAWVAHLSGLLLGFVVGFAIRRSRELVPDEAVLRPAVVKPPPPPRPGANSPWR